MDRLDVANWTETYLRTRRGLGDVTVDEVLKITPASWVLVARINGDTVVVKRFFDADTAARIQGLKRELDHLETIFGDSDCQANRCLMAWPEDGIAVLSHAPGPRLDDHIAASTGQARHDLLLHSGRWLMRYTTGRRRADTFGPGYWIRQIAQHDVSRVHEPADRALLAQLSQAMQDKVGALKGCAIVKAATHGDFAGINLHIEGGILRGVDIQGESWLALAREAARFLVWQQIRDPDHASVRRYGIAVADWRALMESGLLSTQEQETTLPFFIAEQLFGRFVESYRHRNIRTNTRVAIGALLTEP